MTARPRSRPDSPVGSGSTAPPATAGPDPQPRSSAPWRDAWGWLAALSVLPVVLHSLGAPLGESVAEDFDFLRHMVLQGQHSLLDGGGSRAFWRPVAHQLYYIALGPLVMSHPRMVAAIHVALLSLTAVLLYRTFRRVFPGPAAAAIASFPMLSESTRTVISWPGHSVELGSLLFAALALHEASRRRKLTSLAALLLALLCKELAVVAAVMIPLMPGLSPTEPGRGRVSRRPVRAAVLDRLRWAGATGALTAAWGLAYLGIRHSAGLVLPHGLETNAETVAAPLALKLAWAVVNSLRAIISLPATPTAADGWVAGSLLLLAAAAIGGLAFDRKARARLSKVMPWCAWGLAWFALSCAVLVTIYPIWAPNRSLFGAVGLGLALVAVLSAVHPLLLAAMVGLRLAAFALSPGPPALVSIEPTEHGAFMDFERLTRLQRLMADTRQTLKARFPTLPHGAAIGSSSMPRGAIYAFGGDHAIQVWYRDTTLRWVEVKAAAADSTRPLTSIVQYQLTHRPQIAILDPAAVRAELRAEAQIADDRWEAALVSLADADRQQRDSAAVVFRAEVMTKRALCLTGLHRDAEAELESRRALALVPESFNARWMLASLLLANGDRPGARRQVDTLATLLPADTLVQRFQRLLAEPLSGEGGAERVPR